MGDALFCEARQFWPGGVTFHQFMSELHHECGLAAVYHLAGGEISPLCVPQGPEEISRLIPRILLDVQNRGQLSAGMTAFSPGRQQLLETYRGLGSVSEVFRLSHRGKAESIMERYPGRAAIGHVRYATCGQDDLNYAQPFERHHLQKHKWFSFAFNGQLANYAELRDKLLADDDHHLSRDTDTEIIMHEISRELSGDRRPPLAEVMRNVAKRFDGAYCCAAQRAGRNGDCPRPVGLSAAVLRDRRAAVRGGERKRGTVESGLSHNEASARSNRGT